MTDSGVVDPIGVPEWLRISVRRAWHEMPQLARLFIGLAIVDVLTRWFGIFQPWHDSFVGLPGLYGFIIPRELWILLPAILLIRRPDAGGATPLILYGALLVAFVRLASGPLLAVFASSQLSTILLLSSGTACIAGVGWLLLARGLRRLNPQQPPPTVAGLSNLVLGASLLGTGAALVNSLLHIATDGDYATGGFDLLSDAASAASQIAWAYLLWIVIRGLDDTRRPRIALTAAAVGATVSGLLIGVPTVVEQLVVTNQLSPEFWTTSGLQDLFNTLGFLGIAVGETLMVASFALGLAEPPIPYAAQAARPRSSTPEPGVLPT